MTAEVRVNGESQITESASVSRWVPLAAGKKDSNGLT